MPTSRRGRRSGRWSGAAGAGLACGRSSEARGGWQAVRRRAGRRQGGLVRVWSALHRRAPPQMGPTPMSCCGRHGARNPKKIYGDEEESEADLGEVLLTCFAHRGSRMTSWKFCGLSSLVHGSHRRWPCRWTRGWLLEVVNGG